MAAVSLLPKSHGENEGSERGKVDQPRTSAGIQAGRKK